ncbi:MAG: aspartate ammonia-lyase [Candidatus Omnitrophica bacterium]|nr:aspartate ammonia-lyase [Candidatus Omnitrophota bacterium]
MENRIETDLLGSKEVCQDAYWGIHTQRAWENFSITGYRINISLIHALALVKKACAMANAELGYLDQLKADLTCRACDEIHAGLHNDQFIVDALQGGAGTSTNMNINEVIANIAIEAMNEKKGDYTLIHPIEDINKHQSTNDVYPTALKIAVIYKLNLLSEQIAKVQGAFQVKEKEFARIIKIARTELQDAVPITLGLEFSGFAEAFGRDRWRMFKSQERIRTINIGGTAVGTGLTAPRDYIFLVIEKLRTLTNLGICRAENLVDNTANSDAFGEVSGIIKAHAQNLIKISQDLRMLHLLKEIELPAVQAGSSIMPGKINPVIMEAIIQAGLKVIANDFLITESVSRSTFQINEFMPLLADSILESLDILINANKILSKHVMQIKADEKVCGEYLNKSFGLITAFLPYLGYEKATELVQEFIRLKEKSDICLSDFLQDKLGKDLVSKVLDPDNIISLGYKQNE